MVRPSFPRILALSLIGTAAHASQPDPMRVVVVMDGQACSVTIDGKRFSDAELMTYAKASRSRRALVEGGKTTPYRCIFGAFFALQRGGVQRVEMMFDGKAIRQDGAISP